jgi:hypothetical protein
MIAIFVSCPQRMAGETGQEFITRMLAMLDERKRNGDLASAAATSEAMGREAVDSGGRPTRRTPLADAVRQRKGRGKVRKESGSACVRPAPSDPPLQPVGDAITPPELIPSETRHWPPLKGQRYIGPWPPRALYDRAKRARELCKPMPKSTRYVQG